MPKTKSLLFAVFCFLPLVAVGKPGSDNAAPTPAVESAPLSRAALENPAAASADPKAPQRVRIKTVADKQMDVWVDGKRYGLTPLEIRLTPGKHLVTAGADGIEPVLEWMEVKQGGLTVSALKDVPLTQARFPKVFQELVQTHKEYPDNHHVVILSAALTRDRADYEELLKLLPEELKDDPTLLMSEARWAFKEKGAQEALSMIDRALAADPKRAALWRVRARMLAGRGAGKLGMDAAEKAVMLEPMNPENFIARGESSLASGDGRSARLDFERALEIDKDNPRALQGLEQANELVVPAVKGTQREPAKP